MNKNISKPKYFILKLASRCNLKCTYCYWFRDKSVYEKPKKIKDEIVDFFLDKLQKHINKYKLTDITISFHGGEPMLYGKKKTIQLCEKIKNIKVNNLTLAMQTNGTFIDQEWCDIINKYGIGVGISVDGILHDKNRIFLNGRGSLSETINGINLMKKNNINFGVLSVYDDEIKDAQKFVDFFKKLNLHEFDILIPDVNHDYENIPQISNFYNDLFNIYLKDKDLKIRFFDQVVKSFYHNNSMEVNILGDVNHGLFKHMVTINTDGSIEPEDSIRTSGYKACETTKNVRTHNLDTLLNDDKIQNMYQSAQLPKECEPCIWKKVCAGGDFTHRYSSKTQDYSKKTPYCNQLKNIFNHMATTLIN